MDLHNKGQESTSHQATPVTGRTNLIYTRVTGPDTSDNTPDQGQAMELIQDVIQKWPAVPVGKSHKRADGQTPPPPGGVGGDEIIKDREK